jgi:lysozyme family protein
MTPSGCIRNYIRTHEGGLSVDPVDRGNYHHGALVGSKYGVTGDTLARYRGVPAVTAADMAALTLDEAVKIGEKLYYRVPHLDLLLWNRVTASVLDMGWGAGPVQAIKMLQRLIDARDDGQCGGETARLYAGWIGKLGEAKAAQAYADYRNRFYAQICITHPANNRFLKGWQNRTNSFLPASSWWMKWA